MRNKDFPLKEISIGQLYNGDKSKYEIPIYQRNYAWEKDEVSALVQDVYDAFTAKKQTYFIGTLVSFHKGDQVYEVIDGQQRLTTINLILGVLGIFPREKLTYRARKKSNNTINSLPDFNIEEKDDGIVSGYKYAKNAINDIVPASDINSFKAYFLNSVHMVHYHVPKDIDLNHYFEIMNSRGEQLEKHEIIKAQLLEKLNDDDKAKFNRLWEFCSEMNVYIQQKYNDKAIFGLQLCDLIIKSFDGLPAVSGTMGTKKITELMNFSIKDSDKGPKDKNDTFQPIIDFSNFLLIVLKLTMIDEKSFKPTNFILDDKELLNEFDKVKKAVLLTADFVKRFGFNLLKAKYLLDNYLVHHSDEDDTFENNPWKLQRWQEDGKNRYLKNLDGENEAQHKLAQMLSMFEVSFTARQRKNYLFYCLLYLFKNDIRDVPKYCQFVSDLADKYFYDVYLNKENLNEINTPMPGKFDDTILAGNELDLNLRNENKNFTDIYGNGTEISKGIPLFIFNYLDYKLWEKYFKELRGEDTKKGDNKRTVFFKYLGCEEFDLDNFNRFYFSRTRRSLEHFFPQSKADGANGFPTKEQINCMGNFAMIGSEMNSSGSDWDPKIKLDHYTDSGKINKVSVASLKFMIMMQVCKDKQVWLFDNIKEHQDKMLNILGVK